MTHEVQPFATLSGLERETTLRPAPKVPVGGIGQGTLVGNYTVTPLSPYSTAQSEAHIRTCSHHDSMLDQIIKQNPAPVFSGKATDFEEWAYQWEQFLWLVAEKRGGESLNNRMTLTMLRKHLDVPSRAMLDSKMRMNPTLSYYEFWNELKNQYLKDGQAMHRRNWQQTSCRRVGGKLTLEAWKEYMQTYLGRKQLVDFCGKEEHKAW